MEEYLEFAKGIAYQAGKIMLKYFNQNNRASIQLLKEKVHIKMVKKYL